MVVVRDIQLDGVTYHQYRDFMPMPVYPNIPVDVAEFRMRDEPAPGTNSTIPIRWRVSAEDGVFPDPDVPGTFTLVHAPLRRATQDEALKKLGAITPP